MSAAPTSQTFTHVLEYLSTMASDLFGSGNITFIVLVVIMAFIVVAFQMIAITYIVLIYFDIRNMSLKQNTINKDTVKFTASKSCDVSFTGKYLYILFPLLSFMLVAFCAGTWMHVISPQVGGLVKLNDTCKGILYLFTFQSVLLVVVSAIIYGSSYKPVSNLSKRIVKFDRFVVSNMYTSDITFLKALQGIPTNSVKLRMQIKTAICELIDTIKAGGGTDEQQVQKIANAFYTLNLYRHLLKMGLTNANLTPALHTIFSPKNIMLYKMNKMSIWTPIRIKWSSFAYFPSRVNMVVDYSDDYIQMISSNMDKNSYNSISNMFMQARGYCSEWTYKTSELAMDITNDDHSGNAMSSFYAMTFLWLFVSFIPMTVLGIKCYRYAQSFEPAPAPAPAPVEPAQISQNPKNQPTSIA